MREQKPSNILVNENCDLKVCFYSWTFMLHGFLIFLKDLRFWTCTYSGPPNDGLCFYAILSCAGDHAYMAKV